ncbi:uncharacterized protein LOC110975270 [Acanthaster planci]|uniref:Uncharacterized protein LOC110975270 n=1 Tax=Acanthaster planci TaxID=133434 RepID=A0A8B7XTQ0_ACAPL|nr:uncharacterized protein LOC110975270 [Acanthaster planci]
MEAEMDLDVALHELGMLSAVTDSRRDYLNEQAQRRRTSSCYSVLQMNPTYVTCLGPVCYSVKPKSTEVDVGEAPRSLRASGSVPDLLTDDRRVSRHQRSKPRYSRPYHIPKHASNSRVRRTTGPTEDKREADKTNSEEASVFLSSNSEVMPTVHLLTRSKSVDDLSKTGLPDQVVMSSAVRTQHQELEMVSRHLRDLQVSSS